MIGSKHPPEPHRQRMIEQGVPDTHVERALALDSPLQSRGINLKKVIDAARKLGLDFNKIFDFLDLVIGNPTTPTQPVDPANPPVDPSSGTTK